LQAIWEYKMKSSFNAKLACASLVASLMFFSSVAVADSAEDGAKSVVAPFYDALNAGPGKDTAALIKSVTTTDWVSCGSNDACEPRDAVIQGMIGLERAVPDLKWSIKQIIASGNQVVVRGEATGTPAGEFMGVPLSGKSFKIMSTDIHTVEDGKIAKSYHVEDWMSATRQLAGK
jgi:steroid delta-isomerase-like uncharacterized protein